MQSYGTHVALGFFCDMRFLLQHVVECRLLLVCYHQMLCLTKVVPPSFLVSRYIELFMCSLFITHLVPRRQNLYGRRFASQGQHSTD